MRKNKTEIGKRPDRLTKKQGDGKEKSRCRHRRSCQKASREKAKGGGNIGIRKAALIEPQRRALFRPAQDIAARSGAVTASVVRPAAAATAPFPNLEDRLVRITDEGTYKPLRASDIEKSAKPVIAYPYDAATNTVHSESRLNKVLLVYLDPSKMDEETQKRAAGGVLGLFCDMHAPRLRSERMGA